MRLIDADALMGDVQFRLPVDNKNAEIIDGCVKITRRLIENAPTIDAEPVIHGWWIPFSDHMWACSNCRVMGSPQWKRCPVCETKMDGGAEDD